LSGNGQLVPSSVVESEHAPRRLVLDFPDVTSKAGSQLSVDSALVKNVKVSTNSRDPLVTRVVMDLSAEATYHVERSGDWTDLDVVFEPPTAATVGDARAAGCAAAAEPPDPPISMEQKIRMRPAITPDTAPADLIALDNARPSRRRRGCARPAQTCRAVGRQRCSAPRRRRRAVNRARLRLCSDLRRAHP
jgi:hypothetical protein